LGRAQEETLNSVGELDGVWEVRRTGGALPPLYACRKRIAGDRGETTFGRAPAMPFQVRGRELHYRGPFAALVDKLEPDGNGFRGRATLKGIQIGTFEMRRVAVAETLNTKLVKHIDEAHALEQSVLRMLDGMIQTTDDPEILDALEHHKMQTQAHADRMLSRLQAHDAQPSAVRQAAGIVQALVKMPLDLVRGEKAGRNARDGYATEHLEIASYELLKRVAKRAGDEETATACDEIIAEERAFADVIAAHWDRFAELSLQEEGITV
jgi:ferritin-like metal-binding protein YciE